MHIFLSFHSFDFYSGVGGKMSAAATRRSSPFKILNVPIAFVYIYIIYIYMYIYVKKRDTKRKYRKAFFFSSGE